MAAGFTDGVLASPGLRDLVTVRRVEPGEAQGLVDRGEVDAAFLLPAGLSASFQQGGPATVTVVASGESPIAGQVARSLAEGVCRRAGRHPAGRGHRPRRRRPAPTATQARRRGSVRPPHPARAAG